MGNGQPLKERLVEFIRKTGINLSAAEQLELADEYYNMIVGWIEEAPTRRSSFLDRSASQVIKRFVSRRIKEGKGTVQSSAYAFRDSSAPSDPTIEEQIRRRAYELYEARGHQGGFQEEDWARAESEVRAKHARNRTA
jgi:hypothetical protein